MHAPIDASQLTTTKRKMKNLICSISLSIIALSAIAPSASAQRGDSGRVDAARLADEQNREFRGDNEFRRDREWQRWEARTAAQIDDLNRDVRRLGNDVRISHPGRWVRERYADVVRDTDRVTALFRQRRVRLPEIRRRIDEIRGEMSRVRGALRGGYRIR